MVLPVLVNPLLLEHLLHLDRLITHLLEQLLLLNLDLGQHPLLLV
jgi:hypothetical protein